MLGKRQNTVTVENSALVASEANVSKATYQRKAEEKTRVQCDYCNKPRHLLEHSWKTSKLEKQQE